MIYLVRHGRTDANKKFYAGREDVSLNTEGLQQAAALADDFKSHRIDRILCSPLQRAIQTASPLSDLHGIRIQICPELVELDFGSLQGQEKGLLRVGLRHEHLYTPIENGESLSDLWNRLGALCHNLCAAGDSEETVVVVGHYWTNRLLYGRLLGNSLKESARFRGYRPETGSSIALSI